jgi:hypothetical protein
MKIRAKFWRVGVRNAPNCGRPSRRPRAEPACSSGRGLYLCYSACDIFRPHPEELARNSARASRRMATMNIGAQCLMVRTCTSFCVLTGATTRGLPGKDWSNGSTSTTPAVIRLHVYTSPGAPGVFAMVRAHHRCNCGGASNKRVVESKEGSVDTWRLRDATRVGESGFEAPLIVAVLRDARGQSPRAPQDEG